jgi:hypothetical protein
MGAGSDRIGSTLARPKEPSGPSTSQLLDDLETGIEHLRVEYEKYFLGVERQAPAQLHKKTADALRELETMRPRSTVLRFRLNGLRARFVTYAHYWTRVLHQIENGTHRRDVHRAKRRLAERQAADAAHAGGSPAIAREVASAPAEAPPSATPSGPPAPRAGPPPAPSAIPGMDAASLRKLYDDLVAAKRAAGEDTSGMALKALERKLAREAARLQERLGHKVRFEVANVAGKVTLRARPSSKPP